jgi:hypothetical protein
MTGTFEFPLWAVLGLGAALLSTAMMLVQEKFRADGFSLACWNKVFCAIIMIPFVLWQGLPDNPVFYCLLAAQALLWVVSDVIFFRSIPVVGSGVVSRIRPIAVIFTFVIWFFVDPKTLDAYLETPVRFALIFLVLCGSVYFTTRVKKCPVTWAAIKMIWFVIFASAVGPIMAKLVMQNAPISQAPFAWVFCEALFMLTLWGIYYAVRRPVPFSTLVSPLSIRTGGYVALIASVMVICNVVAIHYADNPAYLPAIKFLDSIIILGVYKLQGRKETADVSAGMGIVFCAVALIVLKSWV